MNHVRKAEMKMLPPPSELGEMIIRFRRLLQSRKLTRRDHQVICYAIIELEMLAARSVPRPTGALSWARLFGVRTPKKATPKVREPV